MTFVDKRGFDFNKTFKIGQKVVYDLKEDLGL